MKIRGLACRRHAACCRGLEISRSCAIAGRRRVESKKPASPKSKEALFFTRFSFQGSFTKRYHGGTAQNIWRFYPSSEAVLLTKDYPGASARPMFWNGRVCFASDRDGAMNISTR